MQQVTVRGFSVATRCESVEDFVAKFRDRCDDRSIVVNVVEPRVVGTECAFAILLANKQVVLAGTCVVLEVFSDTNNVFKRTGMRLGIKRLGLESERVFAELEVARITHARKVTITPRRIPASKPTMALPIVTAEIPVDGVAVAIPRRMTQ